MLIIFHYFGIFIFQILRNRKRLKDIRSPKTCTDVDELDLENDLKFDPPVYKQRYSKVYEILLDEKWRKDLKKLVDFGCAEFGLFIYLKNLNIKEISFVDIDELLLEEKIGKIEPLLADRLRRRDSPLEVSVFRGSVVDPDYRLRKTDVVTAIELIEHLYPDTLEAFPYNIFSFTKPKVVIITTPNADFNVMFKRSTGFRHPDHKFEWTREQFEDWATNLIQRFPDYIVEFCGIGEAPIHPKHIGCCSQAAIFTRKDVLCKRLGKRYISPVYARSCQCDKTSPCKGQTVESKLLCNCLCAFCLPDISVGICTYLSCNIRDLDAYRPMKTDPNKSSSDTDLSFKLSYNTFSDKQVISDTNPSYNIFYKLIQKIDYPYEIDLRSENEKLMDTFKYRICIFSHVNSRFYVEKRQQCEIPIRDIVYGDIKVTVEEVRHLLFEGGYQIEKCVIPETGESEYCIISMPQEMEDITSSSEDTDEYSSKSSDCNKSPKFEDNIEPLSDWDDVAFVPKEQKAGTEQGGTSSMEPSTESKKPNPDPLFDSGYLKSPSPLETNQLLPLLALQDNAESVETDRFEEDIVTTPNLRTDDNKLHLKKTVAKEKFVCALAPTPESHRPKIDLNRINELDRFHNMSTVKTFMNNHLRPQNEFKKCPFRDLSVAGTSSSWKKSKIKDKEKPGFEKKEHEEPTILDDAKSLTNCIIQNSLNRVAVDDEIFGPQSELIRDLSPLLEPNVFIEAGLERQENEPLIEPGLLEAVAPPQAVENGDLANNNRDNEGNNLIVNNIVEDEIDEGIDLLNDNLEELVPLLEDNVNIMENNNDLRIEEQGAAAEEVQEAQADQDNDVNLIELEAADSVAQASKEALYDVNSEQDLLEDFDIPPQANQEDVFELLNLHNSVILVGIHPVDSSGSRREQSPVAASIQTNSNSFPNWLLEILGSHVVPEEGVPVTLGSHDEPHFYCQGDGLGVHPSVIAVEIDEAEEADNDTATTTTEESSSNNTADYAEVDPGPSDMFDMSSLPEESSPTTSVMEDNTLRAVASIPCPEKSPNEYFEVSYQSAIEPSIADHVSEGTILVDEVITSAEEEASRRSLMCGNIPELEGLEINSVGSIDQLAVLSHTQGCGQSFSPKFEDHSSSISESLEYQDHRKSPQNEEYIAGSSFSDISNPGENRVSLVLGYRSNSLTSDDDDALKGSESECEQLNNAPESSNADVEQVDSSNESEKSEYFDSQIEEF